MTAVESRLAATLAKHSLQDYQPAGSWSPSPGESWVWCACGVAITADGSPAQLHAAHVAAVIASADDLAVIELPEPQTEGDEGETVTFWPFSDSTTVRTYPRYSEVGWSVHGEPEEPVTPSWTRDFAAALLAAARAAEAVSDRG